MASRIVVFGATGYTGELIASRLVAAGAAPGAGGPLGGSARRRWPRAWAASSTCAPTRCARTRCSIWSTSSDDVLVSTVGPFGKWGLPAVRAAVAAGCTYLDTTGEPEFIRRVFEEFGAPAARSGARLLPAMGYDFAPGALAGALALVGGG